MKNKVAVNFVVWLFGVFLPEVTVVVFNMNFISNVGIPLQYGRDAVIMVTSVCLVYLNIKYLKNKNISKPMGFFFVLLSAASFLYAVLLAFIQFAFRHGFGF